MTFNSKFRLTATAGLFTSSFITGLFGYMFFDVNIMMLGIFCAFFANLLWSFEKIKQRIVFLFFNISIFIFLLGTQFVKISENEQWLRHDFTVTAAAVFLVYISLVFLFFGAVFAEVINKKKYEGIDLTDYESLGNNAFHKNVQSVSLILFFICLSCRFFLEFEKSSFMSGKDYYSFYTDFESSASFIVSTFGYAYIYPLCAFLATLPGKKKTFIPLMLYLVSTVPALTYGVRNPFAFAAVFIFLYYFIRDALNSGVQSKKKWLGSSEKLALAVLIPIIIIGMAVINYSRVDTEVRLSFVSMIKDLFIKQGVSFFTICSGLTILPFLPVTNINYTFGPFIEYFLRSNIMRQILGTEELRRNTVDKALFGNSFADTVSYLTRSDYLQGHGSGSSFIIELFADFGYVGVILGSFILGALLIMYWPMIKKSYLMRVCVFVALTSVFFMPRGSAVSWFLFLVSAQFIICMLLITVISGLFVKKRFLSGEKTYKTEGLALFEKYGIYDFFIAVKAKKNIVIIVTAIFMLIGSGAGLLSNKSNKNTDSPEQKINVMATVYFEPDESYFSANLSKQNGILEFNDKIPAAFIKMLKSEPCFGYIRSCLISEFEEEALEESNISIDGTSMYDFVTFSSNSPSPSIKIAATTTNANKKVADAIIHYAIQYIEDDLLKNINYVKLGNISYFEGDLIPDIDKAVPIIADNTYKNVASKALVFSFSGLAISLLCVFVFSVFNPKINRKNDFSAYGLPFLGELE